jgi:type I restriction enzyme S subunit
MQYGLSKDTIGKICGVFAGFPAIEKAVLYGSRAKGNYKTGSDIDLTLYGADLTPDILGDVTSALDDLLLPYSIDLSLFDELEHAKLREHIERVGVVFYARGNKSAAKKRVWEMKKLSDVCEKITDGTHQTPTYFDKGVIFLSSKNVTSGKINWDNIKYIDTKQHLEMHKRVAPRLNDILLAKNGTTGVAAIVDRDLVFDIYVSLALLRPLDIILPSFMLYFINSPAAKKQFNKRLKGIGVPNLHLEEIREVTISFPKSLSEQQRIVEVLDEAFAGIAIATENAKKNLQNACELFESHLQSIFTTKGNGWVETTLARATDAILTGPFGSILHKSDYVENGIPIVNPAHITEVGIEPDMQKTISKETAQRLSNYIMRKGDIVIGRRGEMGRCALVTEVEDGWLCGTGSFFIKPSDRCDTRYLVRFLRSDSCKKRLEKIAGGAVMPNLNNTDLGNLPFYLPPLPEQQRIIAQLDALSTETKRLETIYQQKLNVLAELKQSILHKAFAGELNTDRLAA